MKKYILTAVAFVLIAGMANAQVAQKKTTKPASSTTSVHKMSSSPAQVTSPGSGTSTQSTTATTGIKRKHHVKKTNSPKKTTTK